MEKRYNHWLPYKTNGCVEKNSQTYKLRCIKCNKDLGINPGGASSHLKSQHQINLDGTSSIKVEKTTPKSAAIPMRPGTTVTHPSDITKMFRDVNSDKRQVVGPRIDLYESDSRKALIKSITSPMPRENWVEERMERDKKHFEERIVEVNLKLGIAKKIGEAEDEGYISRNDAKEMRQSVGLMHRGMTVKTRDTLLEIASDPNQPEIRRNCAIAKLFTE